MPRSARLDAPGVLHHIMIRGIERRKIFLDDKDRENFLSRLEKLLPAIKALAGSSLKLEPECFGSVNMTEPAIKEGRRQPAKTAISCWWGWILIPICIQDGTVIYN